MLDAFDSQCNRAGCLSGYTNYAKAKLQVSHAADQIASSSGVEIDLVLGSCFGILCVDLVDRSVYGLELVSLD